MMLPLDQTNYIVKTADFVIVRGVLEACRRQYQLPKGFAGPFLGKFLEDFHYDQDLVFEDCDYFHSRLAATSVGETDQKYVIAIQNSSQLRDFLTVDESAILAIIGHCNPEPESVISLWTAKIAQRVFHISQGPEPAEDIAKIIPLVFFCGRHRNRTDPSSSPVELALSLLLQLIDRHRDHIHAEFLDRCRLYMSPPDIQSVCDALEEAICCLDDNVILVVIIEGLEFFAQAADMREPTRHLVHTLVDIYRSRPKATMKFLFTSSSNLNLFETVLEDNEVLEIKLDSQDNGLYPEWLCLEPLQIEFDHGFQER